MKQNFVKCKNTQIGNENIIKIIVPLFFQDFHSFGGALQFRAALPLLAWARRRLIFGGQSGLNILFFESKSSKVCLWSQIMLKYFNRSYFPFAASKRKNYKWKVTHTFEIKYILQIFFITITWEACWFKLIFSFTKTFNLY